MGKEKDSKYLLKYLIASVLLIFVILGIFLFMNVFQYKMFRKSYLETGYIERDIEIDTSHKGKLILTVEGDNPKTLLAPNRILNIPKKAKIESSRIFCFEYSNRTGVFPARMNVATFRKYECLGQKNFTEEEKRNLKEGLKCIYDKKLKGKEYERAISELAVKNDCYTDVVLSTQH